MKKEKAGYGKTGSGERGGLCACAGVNFKWDWRRARGDLPPTRLPLPGQTLLHYDARIQCNVRVRMCVYRPSFSCSWET